MKRMFQRLFQSPRDKENSQGPLNKRHILLLAIAGLILIILGKAFVSNDEVTERSPQPPPTDEKSVHSENEQAINDGVDVDDVERAYEKHLETMLNKMAGVSEVEVMVNLDSTHVNVFAKNVTHGQQTTDETDQNGGERKVADQSEETQVVLTRQGDQEIPLLIHTKKPVVRGVFIVAKGVDHGNVRLSVVDAVSKVLDVSTHKISVMPKN